MMHTKHRQLALENKNVKISCVVPVYNEEEIVSQFIEKLQLALSALTQFFEIIIVDDGSQDNTVLKVLELINNTSLYHTSLKLLSLSRNFGKEAALTAGLENCSGDLVILIDADFQHPLNILPVFLQHWADGYDMVYGIRKERKKESYIKRNLANFFYWLMQKITVIDLPSNAGDFRLMDKKVILALQEFPERTRFMKGLYAWVGYKKIAVQFEVKERAAGKSSWGFTKLIELAITGITSFSDIPLRFWGLIGFLISSISFFYAIYIIATTLIYGTDLPGFPTLVVAIMFFGGIQLLSIGILGEYIARIFTEVKQRPRYLIQLKDGFDK